MQENNADGTLFLPITGNHTEEQEIWDEERKTKGGGGGENVALRTGSHTKEQEAWNAMKREREKKGGGEKMWPYEQAAIQKNLQV